jgi:hypothetical protein
VAAEGGSASTEIPVMLFAGDAAIAGRASAGGARQTERTRSLGQLIPNPESIHIYYYLMGSHQKGNEKDKKLGESHKQRIRNKIHAQSRRLS